MNILKKLVFWRRRLVQSIAIRISAFILVGIGILSIVSTVMVDGAAENYTLQIFSSFYEEEENSLDAVYLGSSVTFTAWLSPLAWEHYGIAVSPFSNSEQPFEAAEYLIKEARKTQPDALYIVPISAGADDGVTDVRMHYLTDKMPLSWNKIQLVRKLREYEEIDWTEQLEYLFPLIRYHSRWTELAEEDFFWPNNGYNGSNYRSNFRNSTNVASSYRATDRTAKLSESSQDALESLMSYCDMEQINILFVIPPALRRDEYELAQVNFVKETVEDHGYPVLSLRSSVDDIGLDTTKDYYNAIHTNIHGAIKVTDYLSCYLVENYGFADKRGDPAYSSWDDAYSRYTLEYAGPNVLDVEWECAPRDFSLSAPELTGVTVNGTELTVKWKSTPDAEGYRIYRKLQAKGDTDELQELCWQALDTVGADVLDYTDPDREAGRTYFYTVLPYREKDGVYEWGDYDFSGVKGTATLNAPALLSLEGTENDLTLAWEAEEGADGYYIYRKLPGKSWIQIGEVEDGGTSYTDTAMLADMPYQYRVRAYYYEEDGTTKTLGSYDEDGLLYAPELEPPTLEAAEEDGAILLSWERIEGIQGYTVYRRTEDSEWEQVTTGNLSEASTQFRDITAQTGIRYAYKIEAYIKAGEQERVYTLETGPDWIEIGEAMYDTAMPEIVYLSQTWNQVYVAWEPVASASSYRVYRRGLSEDGSWSAWKSVKSSVTGTTYLDTPPETGTYEYLVQALFKENGLTYYGVFDETGGVSISFESRSS